MKKKLLHLLRYYKEYGFRCTFAFFLSILFPYTNTKNGYLRRTIAQYKYKRLTNYLDQYYSKTAEFMPEQTSSESNCSNTIWTAWLQGEQNAPEVIRLTLASIRTFANGHPVVVLSNDNVDQYIDMPQIIKLKHESGAMGHAHYADVIRMMILTQYGGLWLDATMLLHEPISEEAFECPFYSVGFKYCQGDKYISRNKWLVGIIGGYRNSIYLARISKMLSQFWEEHNIAIDYFVFDYFVFLLYQKDSSFRLLVDNLPQMVHYTHVLRKIINCPYKEEQLEKLYISDQIYCLTYRGKYIKTTQKGDMTFYGYLYNQFF